MKRTTFPVVAALFVTTVAHAQDATDAPEEKAKHFSVALSVGLTPDMASLGSTITQDGTLDTGETTMANLVYSTDKALVSDRDNYAIWHNSNNTDSAFKLLGAEPVLGGPLLGLEIGGNVQYEFDELINFPLYLRAGFHYSFSMSGGHQERTLGDAAQSIPQVAQLLAANGLDPAEYVGGTMVTDYSANWFEIPITLGVAVPIKKLPYTRAYGGIGLSFFQGGFGVGLDIDEQYANVLATHIDAEAATVTDLSPDGAVVDEVDFRIGGTGLNWHLGAQAGTKIGLAFFLELNSSGTAKTVLSSALAPETRQLLTATSSESLYAQDPEWFKRLSFPVVTSGARVRAGVRYYFF